MSLTRLKYASNNIKDIVFGYTRTNESKLYTSIPVMIRYLCMNFFWISERLKSNTDFITFDEEKKIAWGPTVQSPGWTTIYGNNAIDINDTSIITYRWIFRLKNISTICVGIVDHSNDHYVTNSNLFQKVWDQMIYAQYYYKCCSNQDIIMMTLHLDIKELRFQHNETETIYENIDLKHMKYNLAISIENWRNKRIVLEDFETFTQKTF